MSLLHFVEIFIYELVDLLPNFILALLPFRDSLRFSKKQTALFILLLYILLTLSRFLALNGLTAATFLTVFWIGLYLAFYVLFIKAQITKLLFVLLTILNYGSFIAIVFSHFAYHQFPKDTITPYSLYSTVILAFTYMISYPFMYQMISKKMRILITFPENNRYWRFLWLVPATFCLAYYYNLYANGGIISFSAHPNNVFFAVFFNLSAIFVTYLVMHLLSESNANLELKQKNHYLTMQAIQYENLTERIEEARRAKHDLRQSLTVIQSYLQNNDKEGLLQYIHKYISSLPSDSPIIYCENQTVNALIVYYADIAAAHRISFDIDVTYPADAWISDVDAVVLFGNLLENAVEACIRQTTGNPFISLVITPLQGMLVITLDNSYSGTISKKGSEFLSSKENRNGIGTSSIKNIIQKYNGILQFQHKEGLFNISITLNYNTLKNTRRNCNETNTKKRGYYYFQS